MSVRNFLEDEDYDSPDESGSVPDFLSEEDYDSDPPELEDGEYYGGSFSDGVEGSGFGGNVASGGEVFGTYRDGDEDEEEELFDGEDLLFETVGEEGLDDLDDELTTPQQFSPAAVSSPVNTPVVTTVDRATGAGATDGGATTLGGGAVTSASNELPTSSVPNFLSEDDDYELPPTVASAPSQPVAPIQSPAATPPRERRDLSRRPRPQSQGTATSAHSPTSAPVADPQGALPGDGSRVGDTTARASSATTNPGDRSTTPSVSTVKVEASEAPSAPSFDGRAKPRPLTEEEIEALKSPAPGAATRELRYTALKQKETTVRRVGSDGLTPSERSRASVREIPSKVRTPSNGRLSQEELLFYANLGANRAGDFGGSSKKELFLPPLLGETPEQKRERELRVNRALAGGSLARGARTRLTEKDFKVIRFIALFKFVSERQIAKLLSVSEHGAYKRLNDLRKHGLAKSFKTLGVKGSVWVLTETGMDLSGYDLPRGSEALLTLSMVSHQFTVNHVAAYLWTGGANVLREKNFPQRNLPTESGGMEFGERLVSELQIQSAFSKLRGTTKADAYVPQIKRQMANLFDGWQRAGGPSYGPSPELLRGNEHMWTLFPPISNRLNYHVPDLVVARQRGADGKPQSIAVEVELKTKADDTSYERTLDAYRADDRIYRKVVWVCRLKGTAEKITRIAKRNGLADQGRIAIVPIYLEGGSRFTGKDTWSL